MNDAGFWSLVPPVVAIVLALLTREIVLSLVAAILSGAAVHVALVHGGVLDVFRLFPDIIAGKMSANLPMVLVFWIAVRPGLDFGLMRRMERTAHRHRDVGAELVMRDGLQPIPVSDRGHIVDNRQRRVPIGVLPAAFFVIAALFAFTTGASWGGIGILVPIGMAVAKATRPSLAVLILAATLAGSVMGDHCSPISDTTILSSTGAQCKHINHVMTQIPYAVLAGTVSVVLYLVLGYVL